MGHPSDITRDVFRKTKNTSTTCSPWVVWYLSWTHAGFTRKETMHFIQVLLEWNFTYRFNETSITSPMIQIGIESQMDTFWDKAPQQKPMSWMVRNLDQLLPRRCQTQQHVYTWNHGRTLDANRVRRNLFRKFPQASLLSWASWKVFGARGTRQLQPWKDTFF